MSIIIDGVESVDLHTDNSKYTWHILKRPGGSMSLYATYPGDGIHYVLYDTYDNKPPNDDAKRVLAQLADAHRLISELLSTPTDAERRASLIASRDDALDTIDALRTRLEETQKFCNRLSVQLGRISMAADMFKTYAITARCPGGERSYRKFWKQLYTEATTDPIKETHE